MTRWLLVQGLNQRNEKRQCLASACLGSPDDVAAFESWRKALQIPSVYGLVIGRSLLYPPDDDVTGAVDTAVGLMRG